MSDHIEVSGDTTATLKAMAVVVQKLSGEFEELRRDCYNSNGFGGCLVNIADGCSILGCPLTRD